LSYGLDGVPPYHSDENFYVESSRNMVQSGDYLTPVYHDKKRFAKPILYYWLVSVSYKIFGVNLVSARLTSVFFGSLTIALLYLISSRLFEGRVALYSVLIFPATFLHFQISRWATTDIVLSFFILMALYFFVCSYQEDFKNKPDIYLFYLAMALGFMTKGPPAIIIPGLVALFFLLVTKRLKFYPQWLMGQGFVIMLLVIVPWFATMFFLHGDEFKNHIVGAEVKDRLVHDTPFSMYYFWVLFRYHLPWALFFFIAVLHQTGVCSLSLSPVSGGPEYFRQIVNDIKICCKSLLTREQEPVLFCYLWILVCLALFTFVRTEHSRYMLPASSAVAILTARFFSDMEGLKGGLDWLGFKVPQILSGLILLTAGIFSVVILYLLGLIYPVPGYFFLLSLFFLAGAFGVLVVSKKQQYGKQVFAISISLVLAFSFLSGKIIPHTNRYPMKSFSEKILSKKFSSPVAIYGLGNQRARLGVLTGQKVLRFNTPSEIKGFIQSGRQVMVIIREEDMRENFSGNTLKVVAEDVVWRGGRIDWKRMKELVERVKSGNFSNLTEKIYLLSNM